MQRMTVETEAGRLSDELLRRGVAARVLAIVEVVDESDLPMAALAQAGGAFATLADEPDLYSDADLTDRND
jgi:hypothetical protein